MYCIMLYTKYGILSTTVLSDNEVCIDFFIDTCCEKTGVIYPLFSKADRKAVYPQRGLARRLGLG